MGAKILFDNFDLLAGAPNGVEKLRELILQLAMQGKLVKQDLKDESASVLLDKIRNEKEKIIAEKKIKKSDPMPQINYNEIPYELPDGWEWTMLGCFSELIRGVSYNKQDASTSRLSGYLPILRANNINGTINYDKLIYVPKSCIAKEQYPMKSDVLIAMSSGSKDLVGKAAQLEKDFEGGFGAFCGLLRFSSTLNPLYISWFLQSPLYRLAVSGHGKGIGINNLQRDNVRQLLTPIPPLAEQRRIVTKVNELMSLCDELEKRKKKKCEIHTALNESVLAHLLEVKDTKEFAEHWQCICDHYELLYDAPENVGKLRSAILQLAVQGKLVKQNPKDEPASVLLKKIQKEKERLIAEKIIKKSEPFPPIKEDDIPFELPRGWMWARLGDITQKLGAGSTPLGGKNVYVKHGFMFLRSQNIWNDGLHLDKIVFISEEIHRDMSGTIITPGDILLNITGASIGRSAQVPDDFPEANVSQHVSIVRLVDKRTHHFIHQCIISPFFQNRIMEVQVGVSREGLSMNRLQDFLIPLAPLSEQFRIVSKVKQLLSYCNTLETKLTQAESVSENLVTAVVREMVENQ